MAKTYDAIVVGGGPGGYVAAIRLRQLGLTVLLIEKEVIGGVCLNWGCIPSKALIHVASLLEEFRRGQALGITAESVRVDVAQMQAWKDGVVRKITSNLASLVRSSGATVIMGRARLRSADSVVVEQNDSAIETFVATKGIVIATGATPIQIPGFETDGQVVISAREAVSLTTAPKTMVLIGGGVIGMELGMVYQKLGTKVIVVEMLPRLLAGVDEDLVRVVEGRFVQARGEVLLNARATAVVRHGHRATLTVEHERNLRTLECDKVLVAVGFRPNSQDLGIESCNVVTDARGHIVVDQQLRTSVSGVFAIGDVTGMPYLAHRASKQGEVVAEVIAGRNAACDFRAMPSAIFTDPEIATVGLSEAQAQALGLAVKIGRFPLTACSRAMAMNQTAGFVKTIVAADDDRVLGAGIVGPAASELIAEATLAIEMSAVANDVGGTIHAHPTLSEALNESFRSALKEAVHIRN